MRFVRLNGTPIFRQLQMEELLMRHDQHNYCLFNSTHEGAARDVSVVTGLGGRIPELVDESLCCRDKIPIIRRYSGGGTVVVDKNTVFVTFIMNVSSNLFPHCVTTLMVPMRRNRLIRLCLHTPKI